MTAQTLIDARKGDHEAFRTLVEPHLSKLYRTATLVVLDPHLAQDAVQEALVRAFSAIHRFRGDSVIPWLNRLVLNEARRLYRRQKRAPAPFRELEEGYDAVLDPENLFLMKEEKNRLVLALAQLKLIHREVLVLRYFNDYRENEIAQILGVKLGTVKSRLHSARAKMRRHLERTNHTRGSRITGAAKSEGRI